MTAFEKWKVFLELLGLTIWPIVIFIILKMFKNQIIAMLPHIKSAKLPGIEVEMQERKIEAKIEEVADALISRKDSKEGVQTETVKKLQPYTVDISAKDTTLLAFAASKSLPENLRNGIYYDPVWRSHNKPYRYIGLYMEQSVRYVGEVTKIVYCNLIDNELVATNGDDLSKLTAEEAARIKDTIQNCYEDYEIDHDHKFHLVDKFYETFYDKITPYGIMSKKYFWLDEVEGFRPGMTAEQLAKILDGKKWE